MKPYLSDISYQVAKNHNLWEEAKRTHNYCSLLPPVYRASYYKAETKQEPAELQGWGGREQKSGRLGDGECGRQSTLWEDMRQRENFKNLESNLKSFGCVLIQVLLRRIAQVQGNSQRKSIGQTILGGPRQVGIVSHHLECKQIIIYRVAHRILSWVFLVGRQSLLCACWGPLRFLGCSNQGPGHSFIWAICHTCSRSDLPGELM